MSWYAMHDAEPNGVFPIRREQALDLNRSGHGVFATINRFRGPRRIENLVEIRNWSVDIDDGDKDVQRETIERSPLVPSLVVETKNGHHVHWRAKPGASLETWSAIVTDRLVPFFGADRNARDVARILRVPGFCHLKDPSDPFLVRAVWRHDVAYTEDQMISAFPDCSEPTREVHDRSKRASRSEGVDSSDDFWDAVYRLDCREVLERLSGHWAVGGERYTFKPTRRGGHNIVVDGKGTSCWVDEHGRIGSLDKGGPTIAQWLRWFRHDWRTVVDVMKEICPDLEEVDKRCRR